MTIAQSNGALTAKQRDTATDALLAQLLEDLHEAHELVEKHFNRQLDEPSPALADAHGRLRQIVDAVDALDALDPAGWRGTWKPDDGVVA